MNRLDRVIDFIGRLPTTNIRIVSTIFFVSLVIGRYVISDSWIPDDAVLFFLAASLGLDSLHFTSKRLSHRDKTLTQIDASAESLATTDETERQEAGNQI